VAAIFRRSQRSRTSTAKAHRTSVQAPEAVESVHTAGIAVEIVAGAEDVREAAGVDAVAADVTAEAAVVDGMGVVAMAGAAGGTKTRPRIYTDKRRDTR